MTVLTTETRNAIPDSAFALSGRRYPIENAAHAKDAKARASEEYNAGKLTASEKSKVDHKADEVMGDGEYKAGWGIEP